MFHAKKFTAAIAVCALSLAGCSPAPSSAAKDFYMNISKGEIQKAMESVDKKALARKGVSEGKLEVGMAALSKSLNATACGGLKEVTVLSEEVRGDSAKLSLELVCNSGKKMKENTQASKSEGKWLLTAGD